MKWLVIILMLAPWSGFAQTRPAAQAQKKANPTLAPGKWSIESLSVEGNHSYTKDQVLAVAGLKVGQMAGHAEFNAARDRLTACGAFETVSYKFVPATSGYAATFTVTEVEQVYPVRFEELHVSEKDLVADLKAKDPLFAKTRLPATQPVFQRYVKWVQEFLAAQGIEEKIVGSVMPDAPGEYAIVFRPARALPAVAMVSFQGNQVVPQEVLKEAILSAAVGMPYTEDRFREVLNSAVRPVYEARGRVRVSFPTIRTAPAKDVLGVDVFVTVDEADSYSLGKVALDGETPIKPDELLKAGDFKTGDVANFDKVNDGLEKVRKTLRHAGYLQAAVSMTRQIDDGKRSVDVAVMVTAGPQYAMRKLTIVGLDLDAEAEITRIWSLKAGKPFNPDYPEFFLNHVREQGMFDNLGKTKAEFKVDEREHAADVTLTFGGGAPGPAGKGRGGRGGE